MSRPLLFVLLLLACADPRVTPLTDGGSGDSSSPIGTSCRTTQQCGPGTRCSRGACMPTSSCTSDLDCTGSGLLCDAAQGRCVECNTAADCRSSERACIGHTCIDSSACTTSLDCTSRGYVCGPALPPEWPEAFGGMGCAECNSAADCDARNACMDRFCVPICESPHRICGEFSGASCGTCAGEAACVGSGTGCAAPLPLPFFGRPNHVVDGTDRIFAAVDGRESAAQLVEILDAGGSFTTIATPSSYIDGLAVSSTHVYWALTDGTIWQRARTGGSSSILARVPGGTSAWCQGLAANERYVLCAYVDYDRDWSYAGIYRFPVDGGAPQQIDPAQQTPMVADADYVYWSDFNNSAVGRTQIETGARQILATVQADEIALAAGYLYYSEYGVGVSRVPIAGGGIELISDEQWAGYSQTHIYTAAGNGAALFERGLDGSSPTLLAQASELGEEYVVGVVPQPSGLVLFGSSQLHRLTR